MPAKIAVLASGRLRLGEYFLGRTWAWGLFEGRFGTPRREFTIELDGRMDRDTLILDERFAYADGETEERTWRMRPVGAGYEGLCPDIPGVAIGTVRGNAIRWRYRFRLRIGARTALVDFEDWLFLRTESVALDRSYLSKWGIRLGSVTVCYHKA